MSRSDEQRIADIVDAAREVAALTANGYERWATNRSEQLATERPLEMIG